MKLLVCLNALRECLIAVGMNKLDNSRDQFAYFRLGMYALDKCAVYLDVIGVVADKVGGVGVARTVVVDRELYVTATMTLVDSRQLCVVECWGMPSDGCCRSR